MRRDGELLAQPAQRLITDAGDDLAHPFARDPPLS
jgi:hypothetical protein